MGHEVEVKYRVGDLSALEGALAASGAALSSPVRQDDQAYAPAGWSYGDDRSGRPFARLRTVIVGGAPEHTFTVKTPLANHLAVREQETVVTDREQMHGALLALGMAPTVRIVKTRRTGTLTGRLDGVPVSVCVDDVDTLGAFVELEAVLDDRRAVDGDAVQAGLDQIARSWGVPLERTTATYDTLVRDAVPA